MSEIVTQNAAGFPAGLELILIGIDTARADNSAFLLNGTAFDANIGAGILGKYCTRHSRA